MSYLIESFGAGETKRFTLPGRFFLVMTAASGIAISFFRNRQRLQETVQGITTGFSFDTPLGFDEFEITSASAQTVTVLVSEGQVGFNAVNISNVVTVKPEVKSAIGQTMRTVTNSSSTIIGYGTSKRACIVQNNNSVGSIWLNFVSAPAVVGQGLKIPPGGYWESHPAGIIVDGINAIGDIASNPDVFTLLF